MKRFLSRLFKKSKKVYHINYSDPYITDQPYPNHTALIGTIRDGSNRFVGQFTYLMAEFGAVVFIDKSSTKYFIPKSKDSIWQAPDAYIHPELGGLHNAHTLSNFLKLEFGL